MAGFYQNQVLSQDAKDMVSQDVLPFDKAFAWLTGPSTWTSVLCTCLLAIVAVLVGKHVLAPKVEPAPTYSVTIPPQLASDYQWEAKSNKAKANGPEVSSQRSQSYLSMSIDIGDRLLVPASILAAQQMAAVLGLPSTRRTLPISMLP